MRLPRLLQIRIGAFSRDIVALRAGPLPRSAMLRSGGANGLAFLAFAAFGQLEAALLCAVFTNFLCLSDRGRSRGERLGTQAVGAVAFACAGWLGGLLSGNDPVVLVTTFALALFAGFVHGTLPGVEAIPRYAIACFVASAYLPVDRASDVAAIGFGTCVSMTAVCLDDHIRHGRRGIRIARINATVSYPGPRFSLIYGVAAVCGLAIGLIWGQARPYWVPITTLLVMQPDRRANTVRALQRFGGTIVGVVLAFALARALPAAVSPGLSLGTIVVLPFLWPLGFDRNYALGVALISTWVLLLINVALPVEDTVLPVFLARLSNTAIGCAVALLGSLVVDETREG